ITVADHPELGMTFSRTDGVFDMAVNGGGRVVMKLDFGGISVERAIDLAWHRLTHINDLPLAPSTPTTTAIDTTKTEYQAAVGNYVGDAIGLRRAILLFPPGTTVTNSAHDASDPFKGTFSVTIDEV